MRYRAMKESGEGPALRLGNTAEIRFDVASTGGYYVLPLGCGA